MGNLQCLQGGSMTALPAVQLLMSFLDLLFQQGHLICPESSIRVNARPLLRQERLKDWSKNTLCDKCLSLSLPHVPQNLHLEDDILSWTIQTANAHASL